MSKQPYPSCLGCKHSLNPAETERARFSLIDENGNETDVYDNGHLDFLCLRNACVDTEFNPVAGSYNAYYRKAKKAEVERTTGECGIEGNYHYTEPQGPEMILASIKRSFERVKGLLQKGV